MKGIAKKIKYTYTIKHLPAEVSAKENGVAMKFPE
jgi:hypothetical protein